MLENSIAKGQGLTNCKRLEVGMNDGQPHELKLSLIACSKTEVKENHFTSISKGQTICVRSFSH